MRRFSTTGLYAAALGVVVLANVVVLTGAARNRAGTPEARLTLTERELPVPYRASEENSGMALELDWRVLSLEDDDGESHRYGAPAWFDEAKLRALGFPDEVLDDTARPWRAHKVAVSREIFIVLEYDGLAWRKALARAEQAALRAPAGKTAEEARTRLARERQAASRLFAVDAGLDAAALRVQYPDRRRFIVTPGIVEPRAYGRARRTMGHIDRLAVARINVPLTLRPALERLIAASPPPRSASTESALPRYTVDLAYGKRLEPWLEAVRPWPPADEGAAAPTE